MTTLLRTETKLFLRDPGGVLLGVLLPTVILVALGAVPALREPGDTFGGLSFLEAFTPSLLAVSIALLGFQSVPIVLATYREKGVLRRLSTTPVHPSRVLLAQLLINLLTATIATALMVTVAVLAFDVPFPRHPLGFVAAFVLGTAAVFAIGLLVAAFAPRAKTATAVGTVLLLLSLFFAGVYVPSFLLPDGVVAIGEYMPPGIGAFSDAWTGTGPDLVPLLVMAAIAVAATGVAARFFRWE